MAWIDDFNAMADVGAGEKGWNKYQVENVMLRSSGSKKKKKSFLEDNISSIGGLVGGAGGGAVGGALAGTAVMPVLGTAAGALIGAVLGGGLGSAGGQVLENKIVGEEDLSKDVLSEGLIGGATIAPIRAATIAAKGGKAVMSGGGKSGLVDALNSGATATPIRDTIFRRGAQQATSTASDLGGDALRTSTKGKLVESGNRALLRQYGTIDKPTTRTTDPLGTVTQLADIGITKPVDAERVASAITGSEGILSRQVTNAVRGAGDVDTSTLRQVFNDALDSYGIVEKDRKSLTTLFDAQMNKISGGARGSLKPGVNPADALDMMKSLERRIANLRGKGDNYRLSTPEREDQAAVLQLVRDELEDRLYAGAGANGNIKGLMTPEVREELIQLMPSNKQWADYVDNTIMQAGDIGSLRSAQAPFVRVGKMIDNADANAIGVVGRTGGPSTIREAAMNATTNLVRDPANRAWAATTRKLTDSGLTGGGAKPITPISAGGRATLAGVLTNPGDDAGSDPSLDETALTGELMAPGEYEGGNPDVTAQADNPFGMSQADVAQLMVLAMSRGDSDAYKQLSDLYELIGESTQGAGRDMTSAQATAVAKTATASSALDRLEQLYANAGGGGRIQGTLAGVLGAAGGNASAKAYNDQLAAVARYMGRAMGETGAGSDADAQAFIARLPKLTDTPEEARIKLAELRAMLSDSRNNLMYYGGGAEETPAAY